MALEIINCEQNSPEWYEKRCGVLTASNFQAVLTKGGGAVRRTLMHQLVGERIRGESQDAYSKSFSTKYTERGHEDEDKARQLYTQQTENIVMPGGFMLNICGSAKVGFSPDGLIGDKKISEVKTKSAHIQVGLLLDGEVPAEHMAQIQGGLMVSERESCDFVAYCPGLPIFIKQDIQRDEKYITNLRIEVTLFEKELQEIVEQILTKF